jgi:hypothetical protein
LPGEAAQLGSQVLDLGFETHGVALQAQMVTQENHRRGHAQDGDARHGGKPSACRDRDAEDVHVSPTLVGCNIVRKSEKPL